MAASARDLGACGDAVLRSRCVAAVPRSKPPSSSTAVSIFTRLALLEMECTTFFQKRLSHFDTPQN